MEEEILFSKTKKVIFLVFLLALIIIIYGSYFFYQTEKNAIRREEYDQLNAITKLKIEQITQWRNERLSEAQYFANDDDFIFHTSALLSSNNRNNLIDYFTQRLSSIKHVDRYANIYIVSLNKQVLFSLDKRKEKKDITPSTIQYIDTAITSKKIIFTDFHFAANYKNIFINIAAPILNEEGKPFAVLVFNINPVSYLYPLIESWPIPSKTSETIIVKRDSDRVVSLNNLRFQQKSALKFSVPLSRTNLPAVKAVLGYKGIYEGLDYRNIDVLADISPIPGTPWYMITKVDQSEAYSELYFSLSILSILVIVLFIALGFGFVWFYHYRQRNIYIQLYNKEKDLRESQEEFRTTLYSIGEAVITTDNSGKIRHMNYVAEKLTGWKESEAVGKQVEKIFRVINEETRTKTENPIDRVLKEGVISGLANHTILISRDGNELPIADSGAPIKNKAGKVIGVVIVFSDQTVLRKEQKAIMDSEVRYRSLFQNMIDGYAFCKMIYSEGKPIDFIYIAVNPAFEKLTGLKNAVGKKVTELIPNIRTDSPELFEIYGRVSQSGSTEEFEVYLKSMDMWIHISVYSNQKDYFIAIFEVITDRKRAEEVLKDSEERFRHSFEYSASGTCIIGIDKKYQRVNKAFQQIIGYSEDELKNLTFADITHPDDLAIGFDLYQKLLSDQINNATYEKRFISKNGVTIWAFVSVSLIRKSNNEPMFFINQIVDITKRKEIEANLLKLSRAVEQSPVSIIITDIKGNIEYANSKTLEVTGYQLSEIIGKNPHIFSSGEKPTNEYKVMWESITSGIDWRGELHNKKKSGELYWENVLISPVKNDKGIITHFIGIKEDITDRKIMIDELVQAKNKAEEMSNLKTIFLSNMSHELRTPLIGINGFAEILCESLNDQELKEMSENILKSGHRLSETLNLILDITKFESEKTDFKLEKIEIVSVTKDIIKMFKGAALNNGLYLESSFDNSTILFNIDIRAYRTVLNNLVNNALKFTVEGGVIVHVGLKDNYLEIKVSDTGIGIAEKDYDIIFEEFRQASEGFSRNFEGTGLGLSITKKIVEKFGGTISVSSVPGKGSTFTVKLPETKAKNEIPLKVNIPSRELLKNTLTIKPLGLVIDDDPFVPRFLKKYLADSIELDSIADAEFAFIMLKQKKYNLIFMDINLKTGIDGVQAVKEIRKMKGYETVPIIANTAFAMKGDREEFIAAGCSHYLSKPFTRQSVMDLMSDILANIE